MAQGYLSICLHAHLPYVRHPEHALFLEEMWFFEAITETYIPLLRMLEGLEDDGVDYSLLISLSPPLVTMFEDALLQKRYAEHLEKLVRLADREVERTCGDDTFHPLARWYANWFRDTRYWYEERYGRSLVDAFGRLASYGRLELMTCAGTHGFLPLLKQNPGAVRAQVHTAVEFHQEVFGVHPQGMWVPECAYYPGLEETLHDAGVRYFFVDTHAIENAAERSPYGVYAPAYTPNGVAAFARDKETSYQVWAAECGYPGHADYREFYRDVGHELAEEALSDFLIDGHIRVNTGLKYHRITKRGDEKDPYDVTRAREQAAEDAGNFMFNRELQVKALAETMDRPPLVTAMYDAELFGHWWFEGPQFLDYALRKICYDQETFKLTSPQRYLAAYPDNPCLVPTASSWGGGGTYEFWINETNAHVVERLHAAADRLTERVDASRDRPSERRERLLRQMTRELMLAQASDWPFILRTGTSPDYAAKRISDHLARFWALDDMLSRDALNEPLLAALEFADRIFPNINPEWYASCPTGVDRSSRNA